MGQNVKTLTTQGYSYSLYTFALDAGLNERIEKAGAFIYVFDATDTNVNAFVSLNSNQNDKVKLFVKRGVIAEFDRFYLTAPAQAGKSITILISTSYEAFHVLEQSLAFTTIVADTTKPSLININRYTLSATANTETSQSLSASGLAIHTVIVRAETADVKLCFQSGQSGTNYILIPVGTALILDGGIFSASLAAFWQSPTASAVVEVVVMT